jgi:hypothetical protein
MISPPVHVSTSHTWLKSNQASNGVFLKLSE